MPPADLLSQAIGQLRPLLVTGTTKQRIHLLWAAAKRASDLGAGDVMRDDFMALAIEMKLIDSRGEWTGDDVRESVRPHGAEDIRHVISWALHGWNPFEQGPLK
jgi:hypothetical protein